RGYVDDDRDQKKVLQHQKGVRAFTENQRHKNPFDGGNAALCQVSELPKEHALDKTANGDKQAVAEVKLPIAVSKSAEVEVMYLHGCNHLGLLRTVVGDVRHKKESMPETGKQRQN